tara:strand:- start:39170 stop:39598 length:429 start_codon:yes stop_codon:yes gene_type:complete
LRANQKRPALFVLTLHLAQNRLPFVVYLGIAILSLVPPTRPLVGRNAAGTQTVYRTQLSRYFLGRARHPGKSDVPAKEFLVTDPYQGLLPHRDVHALFDFDHLMQSALPGSVSHDATGVFVNDLDAFFLNQIVFVAFVQPQR